MFKKNVLLIALILSCNTTSYTLDNKIDKPQQDKRYTPGCLTLANTVALAGAYVLVSYISTDRILSSADRQYMLKMMPTIAAITTTGCVMVDGMISLDHLVNPSNQKDPKLKTNIKELADQK